MLNFKPPHGWVPIRRCTMGESCTCCLTMAAAFLENYAVPAVTVLDFPANTDGLPAGLHHVLYMQELDARRLLKVLPQPFLDLYGWNEWTGWEP